MTGTIQSIKVAEGNAVSVGDELLTIGLSSHSPTALKETRLMDSLLKLFQDSGIYQLEAGQFVMFAGWTTSGLPGYKKRF